MNIEISEKQMLMLADLVFLGELVVNSEREIEGTVITGYADIKKLIIRSLKSILSKEWQSRLSCREKANDFFMLRVNDYLYEYEAVNLIYILSEQLADNSPKVLSKEVNVFDEINAWRKEFKTRFPRDIRHGGDMVKLFTEHILKYKAK